MYKRDNCVLSLCTNMYMYCEYDMGMNNDFLLVYTTLLHTHVYILTHSHAPLHGMVLHWLVSTEVA